MRLRFARLYPFNQPIHNVFRSEGGEGYPAAMRSTGTVEANARGLALHVLGPKPRRKIQACAHGSQAVRLHTSGADRLYVEAADLALSGETECAHVTVASGYLTVDAIEPALVDCRVHFSLVNRSTHLEAISLSRTHSAMRTRLNATRQLEGFRIEQP
jgi:hypothetical protein